MKKIIYFCLASYKDQFFSTPFWALLGYCKQQSLKKKFKFKIFIFLFFFLLKGSLPVLFSNFYMSTVTLRLNELSDNEEDV